MVVENLTITRGDIKAVSDVSFSVPSGAITVLLGPNGAGKTSTVEHLEGYLPRSSGRSRVLGLDPQDRHRELTARVGVMLQEGGIQTAIRPVELLAQYASFYRKPTDTRALLDLVGLTDRARTPYRRLSGGEKQRLSLALALVGNPELVFLDEPTAGVDLEGRDLIRSLIVSLRDAGTTILLTTHDLLEAQQLAERVIVMDGGRLLAQGTLGELTADIGPEMLAFRTSAGLDTGALSSVLGAGVAEVSPGEYRVEGPPSPEIVARITAWLAEHDEQLLDLSTGAASLEDVFRRLTAKERHQ